MGIAIVFIALCWALGGLSVVRSGYWNRAKIPLIILFVIVPGFGVIFGLIWIARIVFDEVATRHERTAK